MANKENLKSWAKGQSGNPSGRPKGSKNRSTIARKWLSTKSKIVNPISSKEEMLSQEDIGTLALIKKMRNGDVNAYKALLDSGYGQAKEQIDISPKEFPFFDVPIYKGPGEDS